MFKRFATVFAVLAVFSLAGCSNTDSGAVHTEETTPAAVTTTSPTDETQPTATTTPPTVTKDIPEETEVITTTSYIEIEEQEPTVIPQKKPLFAFTIPEFLAVGEVEQTQEPETTTPQQTEAPKETTTPTTTTIGYTPVNAIMYATRTANLRSGNSTDYSIVASVKRNTEVTVIGVCDNGWYAVKCGNVEGFMSASVLSEEKEVTTTTTTTTTTNKTTTTTTTTAKPSTSVTTTTKKNTTVPSGSASGVSAPAGLDPGEKGTIEYIINTAKLTPHDDIPRYNVKGDNKLGGIPYRSGTYYLSDNDKKILDNFAKEHFTADMTNYDRLEYTWEWIHDNNTYASGDLWKQISGLSYVEAIFTKQLGQCIQYNGAFASMMAYMGYDVYIIEKWNNPTNFSNQHFMSEVCIDGVVYNTEVGDVRYDNPPYYYWMWLFDKYSSVLSPEDRKNADNM